MPKVNNYSPKNIRPQRFSPAAPAGKASYRNRKPRPCGSRNMPPLRRNDPPEQPCGKPFMSRHQPSAVPMRQFPPARTGGGPYRSLRPAYIVNGLGRERDSIYSGRRVRSKERHSRRHEIPSRRSVKPFRDTGRFVSGLPSFRETASVAGPLDENGAPHAATSECGENRLVAFFQSRFAGPHTERNRRCRRVTERGDVDHVFFLRSSHPEGRGVDDPQVGLMEVIMKRTGHRDGKAMKPYRETEGRPNGYTRQVSGTAKTEKQAEPQGPPNRPQPIGSVRFYMFQPSKKCRHIEKSAVYGRTLSVCSYGLRIPSPDSIPPKTKFPPATNRRGRGKFFKTYDPLAGWGTVRIGIANDERPDGSGSAPYVPTANAARSSRRKTHSSARSFLRFRLSAENSAPADGCRPALRRRRATFLRLTGPTDTTEPSRH